MFDRILKLVAQLIPTRQVTWFNRRHDPPALAHALDVDRMHTILRQAESGETQDLFAVYRDLIAADNHSQAELFKRKLAMLGDLPNIQPVDPDNPDDVAAADACKNLIDNYDGWIQACGHLLDSVLWPVSLLEKVYAPSRGLGRYEMAKLVPVPYSLLDFTTGRMRIADCDPDTGSRTGSFHDPDPTRYIIHRGHLLSSPDNWGGPMRSVLFWWLFGAMSRDWWARFLERYGAPFLVGKYDSTDDASRLSLASAFQEATRIWGIVISKETEVDIKQAAASQSADAYDRFLGICQREKSKIIIGQSLSSTPDATGMNSGVANLQGEVRQDIRSFDSVLLGLTIRGGLFRQYLSINGLTGRPPRLTWGAETYADAERLSTILANLSTAGLEVADQDIPSLSSKLGFAVRRKAFVAAPAGPTTFSSSGRPDIRDRVAEAHRANNAIAAGAARDLASSFRGEYEPIARAIRESTSADDLEARLKELTKSWRPGRSAAVMAEALEAFAANGAAAAAR